MTTPALVVCGTGVFPVLDDTKSYLETITKEDALAAISQLAQQESEDWFRIGMILSAYRSSRSESEWKDLLSYADANFQVNKRKAYYLIDIYENLTKNGVTIEQVSTVGWTKLKEIAHLLTQDNVDYWVKTANENSTKTLLALLKSKATADSDTSLALDSHLGGEHSEEPTTKSPTVLPVAVPADEETVIFDSHNKQPIILSYDTASGDDQTIVATVDATTGSISDIIVVGADGSDDCDAGAAAILKAAMFLKGHTTETIINTVSELFPNFKIVSSVSFVGGV